jgi:predicted transcriptional regulator
MNDNISGSDFLSLTAQIVSAHVGNNSITTDALPALIRSVHAALANVGSAPTEVVLAEPAVPIRKSVFSSYIVCLEDGKKLKMLKRHLKTAYNMTADEYRAKWGLPLNYPMVAPDYAEKRSVLAKRIGLGRKTAEPVVAAAEPVAVKGKKAEGPRKRG